jgi:lipopolysaccharide/colanic/teichoic acid biosynthesis glycosyltransferase
MPGITGLWQVEARDNPAFDAYERLDLFYVDNWSLEIDFMIMLATLEHVATKAFSAVMGLRAQHEDSEAVQPLSSRFADTGE